MEAEDTIRRAPSPPNDTDQAFGNDFGGRMVKKFPTPAIRCGKFDVIRF